MGRAAPRPEAGHQPARAAAGRLAVSARSTAPSPNADADRDRRGRRLVVWVVAGAWGSEGSPARPARPDRVDVTVSRLGAGWWPIVR